MFRDDRAAREDRGRTPHGLRKKAATLFSVIVLIALVVGSLFGDRGILQLLRQRQSAEELAAQIERLRDENRRLADDIVSLKSDPAALERLAREQLGLARPGETVFVLRDPDVEGR